MKKEIFKQLVGALKSNGGNYFQHCWEYADAILNDCTGAIEENEDGYNYYEISKYHTKSGCLLVEWKREEV